MNFPCAYLLASHRRAVRRLLDAHALQCVGVTTLMLSCATLTFAQSRQIPAPPQNHAVIIHDATIHPVSSPTIERGYIVLEKGVICLLYTSPSPRDS